MAFQTTYRRLDPEVGMARPGPRRRFPVAVRAEVREGGREEVPGVVPGVVQGVVPEEVPEEVPGVERVVVLEEEAVQVVAVPPTSRFLVGCPARRS